MSKNVPQVVYSSSPLVSFGHRYFTPGNYSEHGVAGNNLLPFTDEGEPWSIPQFSEDTLNGETSGIYFGRRSAAAFTIHIAQSGSEGIVKLAEIIADKEFQSALGDREHNGHHAALNFVRQIERYLWALGQLVSPAQLVGDVEAVIAELDSIHAVWRAEEDAKGLRDEEESPTPDPVVSIRTEARDEGSAGDGLCRAVMLCEAMQPTMQENESATFRVERDGVKVEPQNGDVVLARVTLKDEKLPQGPLIYRALSRTVIRRYFRDADTGRITLNADNPEFSSLREQDLGTVSLDIEPYGILERE